jgi:phosphatidylinositol 4-kinase
MKSLVSYSIISYILQLKDRHNGNILIDKEGHIIHIDFGFVLNNSPGSIGFEMAPFKLSQDYIEVLNPPSHFTSAKDGKRHPCWDSPSAASRFDPLHPHQLDSFHEFVELFKVSFKKIRKHAERIITIVELMQVGKSTFYIFLSFRQIYINQNKKKNPQLTFNDSVFIPHIKKPLF